MLPRFFRLAAWACLATWVLPASTHQGQVTFNGEPAPGVTVSASRDGKKFAAITDQAGMYSFTDLADGTWSIDVEMFGFAPMKQPVEVSAGAAPSRWELKLLSLDQIKADIQTVAARAATPAAPENKEQQQAPGNSAPPAPQTAEEDDLSQRAADGFLINGSVNNGAASAFAQSAAFGNYRFGRRGLYNGGIGVIFDNSVFDARPFSLTGQNTPKAAYNRLTGVLTVGGPIQIPRLFKNGPNFFLAYQWTRNSSAIAQSALMPESMQRDGIFSSSIMDPVSGSPFSGNIIPASRISPQARALLALYPLPNFDSNARYNYQVPILSPTHQDALQSRLNKTLGRTNQIYGGFAFQSVRADDPNLFGFLDTTDSLGLNTNVNWLHRFNQNVFLTLGYQFNRFAAHVTPYFANRVNVSGVAGISGNNQDPANWGPPSLSFSSGIASLSDAQSSFNRNQTSGLSYSMLWNRRSHNITFGADYRRQQFNSLSQQDPRGAFTFTGSATGSDFGDFLLGIPSTSAIAFGNADKYFRDSLYDAYFTDDWRVSPSFTLNAGVRWEYGAPITELYGRLVNLDIIPGLGAASPVVASEPRGLLTGQVYPGSLVRPDKHGYQPRIGIAWRPFAGSSLIVRAGYGVYYDTSVYQTMASQMAQQPPLSKTLSLQNSPENPLTLANGFVAPAFKTANTFAIDPNFRVGYAQTWNVSVQRDLPASLQMFATYLGIKGTRGTQEFLPNTYPIDAVNPCSVCPIGFAYVTSNGNSTREAAQLQLRRRLHNGLTATVQYTFSKSIDDDAYLGGRGASLNVQNPTAQNSGGANAPSGARPNPNLAIAQNWLDLRAERALSNFDQRHLLSLQGQYTTGMGLGGGTLLSGWKGALFKDWTFASQITVGSGLPQTPIYLAPVTGTGVTGTIRPDYTGAPLYAAPAGFSLNPASYVKPAAGEWGNAGRNSITGPAQFTLNASLGRTFRMSDRLNLDLRIDSVNALNHVTFTAWNTTINNEQFGLPAAANGMRTMQTTLRLRF